MSMSAVVTAKLKADIEGFFTAKNWRGCEFIEDVTGRRFKAVFESDLMDYLRYDKNWSLPAAGWFNSEVRRCGFETKQGYQFANKVRRFVENSPHKQRDVSKYQTLIILPEAK